MEYLKIPYPNPVYRLFLFCDKKHLEPDHYCYFLLNCFGLCTITTATTAATTITNIHQHHRIRVVATQSHYIPESRSRINS